MFSVYVRSARRDVPGAELSQSNHEELFSPSGKLTIARCEFADLPLVVHQDFANKVNTLRFRIGGSGHSFSQKPAPGVFIPLTRDGNVLVSRTQPGDS